MAPASAFPNAASKPPALWSSELPASRASDPPAVWDLQTDGALRGPQSHLAHQAPGARIDGGHLCSSRELQP